MFDFRLFPGTNFNRINLDWIFSKLKELQEGQGTVTEAAEEATAAAEEATAAAAAATEAASDAIEAIETVTETAEDAQTKARAAELTAARAESNANTAISDAADASAAATSAGTAAAAAQQTATNAGTAAAAAQQTADNAVTAAAAAATAAAAAQQTADGNSLILDGIEAGLTSGWTWFKIGGKIALFRRIDFENIAINNASSGTYLSNAIDSGVVFPTLLSENGFMMGATIGSGSQGGRIRLQRAYCWGSGNNVTCVFSSSAADTDQRMTVIVFFVGDAA